MAAQVAAAIGLKAAEAAGERLANAIKGKPGPKKQKQANRGSKPKKAKRVMKAPKRPTGTSSVPIMMSNTGLNNMYHSSKSNKVMRMNKYGKKVSTDNLHCSGRLLLGSLVTTSGTPGQYTNAFSVALNPSAFPNTTLADLSQQYQKFRFSRVVMEWIPAVSTSYIGTLANYFVYDPEVKLAGTEGTLSFFNSVAQLDACRIGQVWTEFGLVVNLPDDGSEYFCAPDLEGEQRLVVQGFLRSMTLTQLAQTSNFGWWTLRYEIDFWEPIMSNQNYTNAVVIPAISGSAIYTLVDNSGISSTVQFRVPANTTGYFGLVDGTTYSFIPTYSLGYMVAYGVYYLKYANNSTASAVNTNIYTTSYDAINATGENTVHGSYLTSGVPPFAGISYFTALGAGGIVKSPFGNDDERNHLVRQLRSLGLLEGKPIKPVEDQTQEESENVTPAASQAERKTDNTITSVTRSSGTTFIGSALDLEGDLSQLKSTVRMLIELVKDLKYCTYSALINQHDIYVRVQSYDELIDLTIYNHRNLSDEVRTEIIQFMNDITIADYQFGKRLGMASQ